MARMTNVTSPMATSEGAVQQREANTALNISEAFAFLAIPAIDGEQRICSKMLSNGLADAHILVLVSPWPLGGNWLNMEKVRIVADIAKTIHIFID